MTVKGGYTITTDCADLQSAPTIKLKNNFSQQQLKLVRLCSRFARHLFDKTSFLPKRYRTSVEQDPNKTQKKQNLSNWNTHFQTFKIIS